MDWMFLLGALGAVLFVVCGLAFAFVCYVARFIFRIHRRVERDVEEFDQRRRARQERIVRGARGLV